MTTFMIRRSRLTELAAVDDPSTDRTGDLWGLLTDRPISLYAASVLRIGYGLLYLVFLLREFPHRDEIWGPGSPGHPRWHNSSSTSRAGTASSSCLTAAPTSNSAM